MNLNKSYLVSKKVISRKNQDQTVIVMLLDDSDAFFKIEKFGAAIWSLFQRPIKLSDLDVALKSLNIEAQSLIESFIQKNLIEIADESEKGYSADEVLKFLKEQPKDIIIPMSEYNLAQLEQEVLNESVYLDVFAGSDLNLKSNVNPIGATLQKLIDLDAIYFNWKDKESDKQQVGLVAQQLQKSFPEVVAFDDREENLAVAYPKMIPFMIKAIQELNEKVEKQNRIIESLQIKLGQGGKN